MARPLVCTNRDCGYFGVAVTVRRTAECPHCGDGRHEQIEAAVTAPPENTARRTGRTQPRS